MIMIREPRKKSLLSLLLAIFMAKRWGETKKFMPSGLVAVRHAAHRLPDPLAQRPSPLRRAPSGHVVHGRAFSPPR